MSVANDLIVPLSLYICPVASITIVTSTPKSLKFENSTTFSRIKDNKIMRIKNIIIVFLLNSREMYIDLFCTGTYSQGMSNSTLIYFCIFIQQIYIIIKLLWMSTIFIYLNMRAMVGLRFLEYSQFQGNLINALWQSVSITMRCQLSFQFGSIHPEISIVYKN